VKLFCRHVYETKEGIGIYKKGNRQEIAMQARQSICKKCGKEVNEFIRNRK